MELPKIINDEADKNSLALGIPTARTKILHEHAEKIFEKIIKSESMDESKFVVDACSICENIQEVAWQSFCVGNWCNNFKYQRITIL